MCIMEVASRHLTLLTSLPPTVVPVDSDCVSIIGLPLPFQVGPGEGGVGVWAATGSGPGHVHDPSAETHQEVCRLRVHWNQGTPLCDIYYMTEIHVFKTVSVHIFDIYESCIYYRRTCRRGNTMHTWAQIFCTHVRRSWDSMKSRYSTVTVYTVWLRFTCVQCTYLCWCISLRFMRAAPGMQAGEHCVPLVHRCLQPYCIRPANYCRSGNFGR